MSAKGEQDNPLSFQLTLTGFDSSAIKELEKILREDASIINIERIIQPFNGIQRRSLDFIPPTVKVIIYYVGPVVFNLVAKDCWEFIKVRVTKWLTQRGEGEKDSEIIVLYDANNRPIADIRKRRKG